MGNIKEMHENHVTQLLINSHTIGNLRDESDFNNTKYHISETLNFTKQLLELEGTNNEKLKFIEKVKFDLEKFTINE